MRWKGWVIFGVVQSAGFALIYMDHGPCAGLFLLPGLLLLFPGWLIFFVLMLGLESLPQWASYLVGGVLVVCTNALVWYWVAKIDERKLKSSSGIPGSPPRS